MNAVYLHFVWATFDRQPHLTPDLQSLIFAEIAAQVTECGSSVVAIGGVEDHVHVLLRFGTTKSIADVVKQMKGASARTVNRSSLASGGIASFKWQGTYGVFPVQPGNVTRVANYVRGQEEHHRLRTLIRALETFAAPREI